jgi:hypothetical protein
MEKIILEKPTVLRLLNKSMALYGTQQYITAFTAARNSEAMCNTLWRAAIYGDDTLAHANFQGGRKPLSAFGDCLFLIFVAHEG